MNKKKFFNFIPGLTSLYFLCGKLMLSLLSIVILNGIFFQHVFAQQDDGFRGIWYSIGKTNDEYVHKYSGGLGTYPANHYPFSVYAPEVQKTFFCYGGASKDSIPSLLHEVAYFDHRTKMVSRPTIVLDKKTNDAHDNPVLSIDREGYVWIFSTSHGVERPSYIHRSTKPYNISAFEKIDATRSFDDKTIPFDNFSYLQIYNQSPYGFLGLMTHYEKGVLKYGINKSRRTINFITSSDGLEWSGFKDIAAIEEGHYQTSGISGNKIATSFNFHPDTQVGAGLDYRTNLYYVSTTDFGKTWQTANSQTIALPLNRVENDALVRNYQKEGLNVYINDIAFDKQNNPIILYITSKGPEPGPKNAPYSWCIAHWNKERWNFSELAQSDHNYDMGSLYAEGNIWRIIAPTQNGPQLFNTGGEIVLWESSDEGKTWAVKQNLTHKSKYNHSYPRKPINAHPDFYAFWADGHGRMQSLSSFYFSNQNGDVFKLPQAMKEDFAKPTKLNK